MATKPVSNGGGLPSAADLDQVAEEQKAAEATSGTPAANTPAQERLASANAVTNSHLAADTTAIDSVGKPKDGGQPSPVGPRGTSAPRDSKPAPNDKEKRAAQPKVTVTDQVDSAGNEKNVEHHVGIRGQHSSRDTYKL
jgi:hypothetical protein